MTLKLLIKLCNKILGEEETKKIIEETTKEFIEELEGVDNENNS